MTGTKQNHLHEAVKFSSVSEMPRAERSYTLKRKREALALVEAVWIAEASRQLNIAHGTVHGWTTQADAIWNYKGHVTSKSLKDQGRKEIFPSVSELVTYMTDTRREEACLSTSRMIQFMWEIQPEWMDSCVGRKENAERALEKMVQRMAKRYGFSSQEPR